MFQQQQTANDLNKAREEYSAILEKGKELGLDEAAHAEPVHRSVKNTHDIEGTETVHATVPKRSVDPKCHTSDPGNQFIPVTTSSSEHTSAMKVLMKFDELGGSGAGTEVHGQVWCGSVLTPFGSS
jgi:hypothetical protein